MTIGRRIAAEGLGTAFLLMAVVGSGIMGERLAGGNDAIALLANSLATGAALSALLLAVGPVSGAHLNPVVSVALAIRGAHAWADVPGYVIAQVAGALGGVAAAHVMFGLPVVEVSQKVRSGWSLGFAETVATFGLVAVVIQGLRHRADAVPYAVAAYITAAYWFTASTSFANPAVTLARCFTDTFTGIDPASAPGFVAGQVLGAGIAVLLLRKEGARG